MMMMVRAETLCKKGRGFCWQVPVAELVVTFAFATAIQRKDGD
jgi:hypothetical protein